LIIYVNVYFNLNFTLNSTCYYNFYVNMIILLINFINNCVDPIPSDPCVPSPCGPNTRCRIMNGAAICECLQGYEGSPSTSGCRPECVISPDCPRNRACVNNKCVDPCIGVCGYDAICQTINHSPVCSCPPPTIGDPFVECKLQPGKCFVFI